MTGTIIVERSGAVAILTLNRPQAMNALSIALRTELRDALQAADADPAIGAIILTGAGDRAFSAGVDLKELAASDVAVAVAVDHDHSPVAAIERCAKPVIAAINGLAITGGFELALACDILVASETARFADTHSRVGVMPTWGLSQRLSRTIGIARAKELSLSARFLDAATACQWGLVNRVVPAASLLSEAIAIGEEIAAADQTFIAGYKRLIDEGFAMPFSDARQRETAVSNRFNAGVTADSIESRRQNVQANNRKAVQS
jgi:enoyl-CoA hydratase